MATRQTVSVGGGALALVVHLPESPDRVPGVVACHGLGASKDSDKYLLLGEELPRAGLALARFDFRGCGESSGTEAETTVATRIADLAAVLDALAGHPRLTGRFGLLGSSFGGFVALHVAQARDLPVVTWNAPSDLSALDARHAESPSLGPPFFVELRARRYAEAPRGVARHLVIQAAADDVVAPHHGVTLHRWAGAPRDLVVIPGADHRLSDPAHRREALARSRDWLRRFLT